MKWKQCVFGVLAVACFAPCLNGQQAVNQVISVLKSSLTAQAGTNVIQDVSLTGLAESITGSDDETVPFTFKAIASGFSRTELDLSDGRLTEIRQVTASGPSGSWSVGDGDPHPIAGHNLLGDAAWYFPMFTVRRLVIDPNAIVSFVAVENGVAHFKAIEAPPGNTPANALTLVQHLGEVDLYLDTTSLFPKRLSFVVHPDNNASIDIQVSIQFSNYQQVNGAFVPMRVQKYVNGVLTVDAQVQTVNFNTGLTPSNFNTH